MILEVILFIVFFVLLQAFFSGSEMAVVSVNRIKMEQLAQAKLSQAVLLKKMLASPDKLLSTTLVGTNLSVVTSSAVFTTFIVAYFGQRYTWLTSVVMTPVILIFGEAIPKTVFRHYADKITYRIVGILRFFSVIFWPLVIVMAFISRIILFPFKTKKAKKVSPFVSREELKLLIREIKKDEIIKPHERAIIHRIFEFGSKKVKEIMVPLKDIVSMEAGEGALRLKELSREKGFSRILVYEGEKDNITGFANVFDALYEEGAYSRVGERLRPVLHMSSESPIDKVFYALQLKRMQVAVLEDENKKNIGMVTFKDLLDEITGEM
ncbi:MAG: HlyC/CorC family transporter [Candidatus Omnitrophota bacterium]|nr:MAG: HlyC/CorC family transporter [Candidatus Omnitrophota bacterium]